MERLFVTGINGLLGTNLCHDLLNQGYYVTGLVRNKHSYKGKYHKNLKLIEGHLFNDFSSLLKKTDGVIHIAATTSQNLLNYSDYWKINCDASIQLYHAAIEYKVKRFIFVSTANTLGFGSLENPGTETSKMSTLFKKSFYAKSKREAEQQLLRKKHHTETIIVNPAFMLGAYDTKPGSGKIIFMGWKKKIIFYPPGGKNFVHVKDVSKGIIRAFNKGVSGERYLLANENLSYKEFFEKLNIITNQNPLMVPIPKLLLIAIGYLGNALRSVHIKTNLSLTNMRALCIENYYANNKSITFLGVDYQSIDNAIVDAVTYFSNPKT